MKYPNLLWALDEAKLTQFELAALMEISESRLSRALNGRLDLAPRERARIARILRYPEGWLFRKAKRPPRVNGVAVTDESDYGRGIGLEEEHVDR